MGLISFITSLTVFLAACAIVVLVQPRIFFTREGDLRPFGHRTSQGESVLSLHVAVPLMAVLCSALGLVITAAV